MKYVNILGNKLLYKLLNKLLVHFAFFFLLLLSHFIDKEVTKCMLYTQSTILTWRHIIGRPDTIFKTRFEFKVFSLERVFTWDTMTILNPWMFLAFFRPINNLTACNATPTVLLPKLKIQNYRACLNTNSYKFSLLILAVWVLCAHHKSWCQM